MLALQMFDLITLDVKLWQFSLYGVTVLSSLFFLVFILIHLRIPGMNHPGSSRKLYEMRITCPGNPDLFLLINSEYLRQKAKERGMQDHSLFFSAYIYKEKIKDGGTYPTHSF